MKESQAKHSWKRLAFEWEGNTRIGSVEVDDTEHGFEPSKVALSAGAAILVGVNSAGKSRLLRELYQSLSQPSGRFARIEWEGESPAPFSYVDLFDLVERQFKFFRDNQYEDLAEQAGFIALKSKEIREASHLVGREYELIEVAEIDSTDVDSADSTNFAYRSEVVPLFRVTSYSRVAYSPELSRGEISVLTTIWIMKQAEKSEVVFWDEPDAFLSPASSGRLLTLIADWSNERKRPTVMSSHSYLGLSLIPLEVQVMVRINTSGVSRIQSSDEAALWATLRVSAPKKTVFVVEDRMARALLDRLLIEISFPDYDSVEIWLGRDVDGVEITSKFAGKIGETSMKFVGVLDGDSRSRIGQTPHLIALPWDRSPEKGALDQLQVDSAFVGEASGRLPGLLESTMGFDPHDRFTAVARGLGRSPEEFMVECWLAWLKSELGVSELRAFAESCFAAVSLIRPAVEID